MTRFFEAARTIDAVIKERTHCVVIARGLMG